MKIPVLASHLFFYRDPDPAIRLVLDFGSSMQYHFSSLILCVSSLVRGWTLLENSEWFSPSAAPLAWTVGLWNVLLAEWDQSADKHSSAAVEIRDGQVAARG